MLLSVIAFVVYLEALAWATPTVLYEGRAPFNYTESDIDQSTGPYFSGVKGTQDATHYFQVLGTSFPATPLWSGVVQEQPIRVLIDNSSVFTPGQNQPPQFGFRRSELIAQPPQPGNRTAFDATLDSGTTAFHFSVHADTTRPLNLTHEYQVVFVEPTDGTHVFDLQIGTPFNTTLSADAANVLRVRAHNSTVLFQTPFLETSWHNFAVVVDWDNLTLKVLHSVDGAPLQAVTNVEDNSGATSGPNGQGEFHFGVLKLPLIDPSETPAQQADVVHQGIQEVSSEALIYSGIFVESTQGCVSIGGGQTMLVRK